MIDDPLVTRSPEAAISQHRFGTLPGKGEDGHARNTTREFYISLS
jgi:hypothetical protein